MQLAWEERTELASHFDRCRLSDPTGRELDIALARWKGSPDTYGRDQSLCDFYRADEYGILRDYQGPHSMRSGDVIMDVGANVGAVTVLLAKLYPTALIYAIEANPLTYFYARRNVRANGVGASVHHAAISDVTGAVALVGRGWHGGSAGWRLPPIATTVCWQVPMTAFTETRTARKSVLSQWHSDGGMHRSCIFSTE